MILTYDIGGTIGGRQIFAYSSSSSLVFFSSSSSSFSSSSSISIASFSSSSPTPAASVLGKATSIEHRRGTMSVDRQHRGELV